MSKRDYRKEAMEIVAAKLGKDELEAIKKKCQRKPTGRRKYKNLGALLAEEIVGIPAGAKVTGVCEEDDKIIVEAEHQTGTKIKRYAVTIPKPKTKQ